MTPPAGQGPQRGPPGHGPPMSVAPAELNKLHTGFRAPDLLGRKNLEICIEQVPSQTPDPSENLRGRRLQTADLW